MSKSLNNHTEKNMTTVNTILIVIFVIGLILIGVGIWIAVRKKNAVDAPIITNDANPETTIDTSPIQQNLASLRNAITSIKSQISNIIRTYQTASPTERATLKRNLEQRLSPIEDQINKLNNNLNVDYKLPNLLNDLIDNINGDIRTIGQNVAPIIGHQIIPINISSKLPNLNPNRSPPKIPPGPQPGPSNSEPRFAAWQPNIKNPTATLIDIYQGINQIDQLSTKWVEMWNSMGLAEYQAATPDQRVSMQSAILNSSGGINQLDASVKKINDAIKQINRYVSGLNVRTLNSSINDANRAVIQLNQRFVQILGRGVDTINELTNYEINSN